MTSERDRLSEQVHLLGDRLGETIVEQKNRALFDLVKEVRGLAKAHRAGDAAAGRPCSAASRCCRCASRAGL
jgi:phosphoenolpyruvate carboxylase